MQPSETEVDELARTMHKGLDGFDPKVDPLPFDRIAGWCQEAYRRQARAAFAYIAEHYRLERKEA